MPDTHTLQTILRNTSGKTRYFAYAGRYGATLADDADIAINGTISEIHGRNAVMMAAYRSDLESGDITIMKSPDVYCYDETDTQVLVLGINNSAPVAVAPDYGSYYGPEPDVD